MKAIAALREMHAKRWLQPEEAIRLIGEGKQVIVIDGADRHAFVEAAKEDLPPGKGWVPK